MIELFRQALKSVAQLKNKGQDGSELVETLRRIVVSTDGIGYGYHDDLADMYYESFGPYEETVEKVPKASSRRR